MSRIASLEISPLAELVGALLERYSDDDVRMLIEFQQLGRDVQERHAAWLRERLRARRSAG